MASLSGFVFVRMTFGGGVKARCRREQLETTRMNIIVKCSLQLKHVTFKTKSFIIFTYVMRF